MLTQTERKYLLKRLSEERSKIKKDIREKYCVKAKRLTPKEIMEALKSGEYTLREGNFAQYNGAYIRSYFIFTNEDDGYIDNEAMEKANLKVDTEFNRLSDSIMLGDGAEALKYLEEFIKFDWSK